MNLPWKYPISLFPILSKMFEKLFLKLSVIPDHRFGFCLVEIINNFFGNKQYCSATFLVIAQAFDKVWHQDLLFKLKSKLPLTIRYCKYISTIAIWWLSTRKKSHQGKIVFLVLYYIRFILWAYRRQRSPPQLFLETIEDTKTASIYL